VPELPEGRVAGQEARSPFVGLGAGDDLRTAQFRSQALPIFPGQAAIVVEA
jgi:hypothetical protein